MFLARPSEKVPCDNREESEEEAEAVVHEEILKPAQEARDSGDSLQVWSHNLTHPVISTQYRQKSYCMACILIDIKLMMYTKTMNI